MQKYSFSKDTNSAFSEALNSRVNSFFKMNKIDRRANQEMVNKTVFIVGYYFTIYLIILFGGIENIPLLFVLWAVLGLGQAFVGITVMHDFVHGSYSKNKYIKLILEIPVIAIGVESKIWKIEHNVLHHTYPNVSGLDDDIETRFVFRFTKDQPKKWFHKYQHLYATFIYGLLIIEWVTVKDFMKIFKYKKMGFIQPGLEFISILFSVLIKKFIFFLIFLIVPMLYLDLSNGMVISMFLTMLVVAGVVMTIIFQTAHVLPICTFRDKNDNFERENWHIHQLMTTSNFAMDNKLLTYFFGGLNYQIEHHLFPDVSHVHYPKISTIIKNTAKEFNTPYIVHDTFRQAVIGHYSLLKELGKI